jgi:hypothetical protein
MLDVKERDKDHGISNDESHNCDVNVDAFLDFVTDPILALTYVIFLRLPDPICLKKFLFRATITYP